MGEAKHLLYGAVGLLLTVALIYISISIYEKASNTARTISEGQSNTAQVVEEYRVTKYDGYEISGSQAIHYIKDVVGTYEIPVTVVTAENTSGFTVSDSTYYSYFRKIGSAYYINPMVQYSVTVSRDANGVITEVDIHYVTP